MSKEEVLRDSFVSIKTDPRFTEAVVTLRDESLLYFCHRVGERWAKAVRPEGNEGGCSQELLVAIRMFRLKLIGRHLAQEKLGDSTVERDVRAAEGSGDRGREASDNSL